ncbi:uncharacterized protein BJ171DRAFT_492678 [Polychytrium aggregatum]|uniref:uncharacterized protein n=1 Tax=Polychytrium aggregatum TaxID=110093 RepID=UPI0022FE89B5|nr:uncharacterized protein BJ171DRAFT_492678 [Polychytrium aggregatum]KAI9207418.1 hypothetical protein BJ171DRAFT_492678 [Polychytrium aggregatum]
MAWPTLGSISSYVWPSWGSTQPLPPAIQVAVVESLAQANPSVSATQSAPDPLDTTPRSPPAASPEVLAHVQTDTRSKVDIQSDEWYKYNKYILGGASIIGFGSLIYTIRERTKGRLQIPLDELLNRDPTARAANPKLAAYMFAGRAFGTATLLMLTGTCALTMGVASWMQVNSLKEFSEKAKAKSRELFPKLYQSNRDDGKFDQAAHEFLTELREDFRREREGEGYQQTEASTIISKHVKDKLGLKS